MTINFYLDSKLLDNNEKSIICFIRGLEKGKTTYINTKLKINPEFWNSEKQNIRRNHINSSQFNSYLQKIKSEIQVFLINILNEKKSFDLNNLKSILTKELFENKEDVEELTFYEIFDQYILNKQAAYSLSYIKKLKTLKAHLKKFESINKYKLKINKLDSAFFDMFLNYGLTSANLTNNTINKLVKQLKSFLFWALERNYLNNMDFKRVKTKEEKIEIVYLTEEELLKLVNIDLEENVRLKNVRDIFCLSCFTGARFSDISNLKLSDIKNNTWYLRTQKTKDILEIPLNIYALEILSKYMQSGKNLPVISNQKSNQYLKELSKIADIDELVKIVKYKGSNRIETVKHKYELVSTHTARRTFVTLSLEKGMRPETVMEITGHKDYKTMKKYIKITSKVKFEEMNNVWKKI